MCIVVGAEVAAVLGYYPSLAARRREVDTGQTGDAINIVLF